MTDKRLRRDIVWNLVPVALLAGVGLGSNFAIFRWWGPDALAIFNLVTTAVFVFAVIGAFGLQFSVLRAVAEAPLDRARIASVVVGALVPNLILAVAVTAGFLLLRGTFAHLLDSPAIAEGMVFAAPGLFCFSINKVLFNVVNGLRRMRAFAVYTSLRYVLIAVGVIAAKQLGFGMGRLPIVWTITECTMFVVLSFELLFTVDIGRASSWRGWMWRHLDFGGRGVLATLAYEINTKLDIWMLGVFGIEKNLIGVYVIAAALNEGATQLAVVLQNNLNPMMAKDLAEDRPKVVAELARRTRRWFVPAFALACAVGTLLFPSALPWLMKDSSIHAGAVPFAVLMGGLVLASPYLPFTQILLMANRPGWHTGFVITVMAINFIGDVVLIPRYGLLGAAIATAAAVVSSAILIRILARGLVRVSI
jgi:O-antigen/teichoic acid export membrane protein